VLSLRSKIKSKSGIFHGHFHFMGKSDLLLELYSNLSTTGALAFSSKALVNKMLTYTDIEHAKLVVELGGGDGSISQGIIERLSPDGELLIFEINRSFCDS